VVVLACIPTSSVQGFLFPTSLPTFVVDGVFYDSYSNRSEAECSVVLICIAFMARDEHFFMCFLAFGLLPLKKFCLVQLPTSLLVH
jgi:hypothetical protein